MDKTIKLIIDNIEVSANPKETILDVARRLSIKIPTLCHLKDIHEQGNCRVCVVEVEGRRNLVTSCNSKVVDGMVIKTNSNKVLESRKSTIELILSNHQKDCLSCGKNLKCTLQKLSQVYMCNEHKYSGSSNSYTVDESSPSIVRNNNKCILCGRCVAVCKKVQETSAIARIRRGFKTIVACSFDKPLSESTCVGCGQCVLACPTGALLENSSINKVLEMLNDPTITVVAQVAPAVRVALAEEFGNPIGTFNEGKIAASLKRIGFKKVFDVNVGADFTVIEEGEELIDRLTNNKNLPLFSSCCPSWFNYIEKFYSEFKDNLSTCKTPNQMLGSLIKNYYAKKEKIENIKVVTIMPCTAKKGEILKGDDVDASLTTRELAYLINLKGIDFNNLPEENFDSPLGEYSGAGLIFGTSGGVTEAVLRTVLEKVTKKKLENYDYKEARPLKGIKEITISKDGVTLNICIVSGLTNANKVLKQIISKEKKYDFVEVMACPGGCVNGGGQPFINYDEIEVDKVIELRSNALYKKDKACATRKSDDNKYVLDIYEEFFKPNKHLAHQILHYRDKHDKMTMLETGSECPEVCE